MMTGKITPVDVVAKFGSKMPSEKELALFMGFTEAQADQLGIYVDPVFNKGWIYMSDEIICNELTQETGRNAIPHFYARVLLAMEYDNGQEKPVYVEGVDYMQVDANSVYVTNYEKLCAPLLVHKRRGGSSKKYYVVTGRTYKRLLMRAATKKGSETCNLYLMVEDLYVFYRECAAYMYQILAEIAQRESQEKDARINQQLLMIEEKDNSIGTIKKELEEKNEVITHLQQCVVKAEIIKLNQYVYIATCDALASKNIFKVGGVSSWNDLDKRLKSYQTPHSVNDPIKFVYIAAVSDFRHVEHRIEQAIGKHKEKSDSRKETYELGQEYLVRRVDAIVKGFAAENVAANADADLYVKVRTQKPVYDLTPAKWPDPPANEHPRARRGRPQAEIKEDDPIAVIVRAGLDNLTDEQKRDIGRQLLSRVVPNIDYEKELEIPCERVKQEIVNMAPNKDKKKAKIRKWGNIIKTAIANTSVKITGGRL